MVIEKIAEIAHDIQRSFRLALREPVENKWADESEEVKAEILNTVSAIAAGKYSDKIDEACAEMHEEFLKKRLEKGYVFGQTECRHTKVSPLMVRFKDLPLEQKSKYYLMRQTVLSLVNA